jgi:hypothetical protein
VPGHPYEQGFDLRLVPEKLEEPLKWKAPRFIFVNSMSDLFQPGVPDDYIIKVATVMKKASWHTFQVLTKRSERMCDLLNSKLTFAAHSPHIWWGVSVENRKHGREPDWSVIEKRIQAAESAILGRLHEFSLNHGGTPEENNAIADALNGLKVLRKEAASWALVQVGKLDSRQNTRRTQSAAINRRSR